MYLMCGKPWPRRSARAMSSVSRGVEVVRSLSRQKVSYEVLDLSLGNSYEPGCPPLMLSGLHEELYDVRLFREDVVREVASRSLDLVRANTRAYGAHIVRYFHKRGRPPTYPWSAAKIEFDRLITFHGLPVAGDPDLPNQAAVERLIAEFIEKEIGKAPPESLVRTHVGKWRRAAKQGDGAARAQN